MTGNTSHGIRLRTRRTNGRTRHLSVLFAFLVAISMLSLSQSPIASADDPALSLSPESVSCTSTGVAHGIGFTPGDEVIISPGGVEDVPGTVFEAYSGPVTVTDDGTFTIEIEPGIFIYDCFGGPLGRDGAPYQFTASVVTGVTDPNTGAAFGPPHASATFSFAIDPDDPELTLTPDHGSGCIEVTAHGRNFEPGTYVTIHAGELGGHNFGQVVDGHPIVNEDGTFSVTFDPQFTPFVDCNGQASQLDGTRYLVSAITGRGPKPHEDDWRDPQAADVFTVKMSASDSFHSTWARTDLPVDEGSVARTWMWGPQPFTEVVSEPYAESPGGERQVRYYDKSRMEVTHPEGDLTSAWYVTNGLLVVEMVEGMVQIGDAMWIDTTPADIPLAGDGDADGITYADIDPFGLLDAPPLPERTLITEVLGSNGEVTNSKEVGDHAVFAEHHVPETGHTVADVFWDFMNAEGLTWDGGDYVIDGLFLNPFYATGYPITDAYWSTFSVAGAETTVLWQCFERRCLTYTPTNPDGWKVESGNIGLHYYQWRYPASSLADRQ